MTAVDRPSFQRMFFCIKQIFPGFFCQIFPVSMGIKNIMSAKKVLLLASGKNKAKAVYESFFGPIVPGVPASVLQLHNDVIVIADEEALSLCREKGVI